MVGTILWGLKAETNDQPMRMYFSILTGDPGAIFRSFLSSFLFPSANPDFNVQMSRQSPDVGSCHINISSSFSCNLIKIISNHSIHLQNYRDFSNMNTKIKSSTTQTDILPYFFSWMSDFIFVCFFNMFPGPSDSWIITSQLFGMGYFI